MSILMQQRSNASGIRFPWTTKEVMLLKRLYHKGMARHKISQRLKRSPDAVQKALIRFEIRKKKTIVQTRLPKCTMCNGRGYLAANGNMKG